jgi:small-conductance mechanosensitive channel
MAMSISEIITAFDKFAQYPIVTINQNPVTLTSITIFCVVLGLFVLLSRAIRRIMVRRLFVRFELREDTRYALVRITQYTVVVIGGIVAFQFIGIDLSGLAVIFGLLSVGIGFGLQNLTSNFVAGLILLFERPIRVGDRVSVGETEGDVREINIRSTTIRSINNISIIVPNSEFISSTVVNWSHGDPKIRVDIDVGVSYGSDLDAVLRSLKEVAEENPRILREPKPIVYHMGFGDSAWNMRLWVWIDNPKEHRLIRSEINCAVVRKFRENGVEIPFPQRDLHLRSPLPLPLAPENALQVGT